MPMRRKTAALNRETSTTRLIRMLSTSHATARAVRRSASNTNPGFSPSPITETRCAYVGRGTMGGLALADSQGHPDAEKHVPAPALARFVKDGADPPMKSVTRGVLAFTSSLLK